jgi:hypothetical protein
MVTPLNFILYYIGIKYIKLNKKSDGIAWHFVCKTLLIVGFYDKIKTNLYWIKVTVKTSASGHKQKAG